MTVFILFLAAIVAWFVWVVFLKPNRFMARERTAREKPTAPYILKADTASTPGLAPTQGETTRLLTYDDELQAARTRQRLWIRYSDRGGNVTERKIEIYHPEDDEYVFAWCCSKQEPRTFNRRSIQSWKLLPERFEFDPIVEQYWREEGTRDQSEKLPWRRWLQLQPRGVADRYEGLEGETLTYSLSTGEFTSNRPPAAPSSPEGPRWWELRDQALLKYSRIRTNNLADYQAVIELIEKSIAGGASVSAQARLNRVLGEIYHHCGQNGPAIEYLERAIKLDPGAGVKKLLVRLKEDAAPTP
jgi:tetratricopeptide (TPR) repeat protein